MTAGVRRRAPVRPARRRAGGRSAGFSLLEVVVAIAFFGIGLLAVAQMVPMAATGVTQARVRTNAVQAAQEKLDDLRSSPFSSAALTAGNYSETMGDYALTWTIADNTPVPRTKRIDLTASWQTITGTKTVNMNTHITAGR